MKENNLTAIDQPDGTIVITRGGMDEIIILTPIEAIQLASCLKNAVTNHCIEMLRLAKES